MTMKKPHVGRNLAVTAVLAATIFPASAWAEEGLQPDVVYGHKDGLAMTMDVFPAEGESNQAAILFVVSGGWFSRWSPPQQIKPLFQPYLAEGYTVFAVRHGSSPRYSIPEAIDDLRQAVRFVRKNAEAFAVDADRLGVMGMSAGGHLALLLGTTGDDSSEGPLDNLDDVSTRVSAVVALVPPTDLRVMVWEAPESLPAYRRFPALDLPLEEAKEVSPLLHVTADDAPALVFAGGKDDLVPPKHAEWIEEAFERVEVAHKVIVFPDAGHGLEGDENRARVVRETIAWFHRHLLDREN
jgi:acetyl esterase/lipase